MPRMKVAVFAEPGRIGLDEKLTPDVGERAGNLFGHQRHGVLKVAVTP